MLKVSLLDVGEITLPEAFRRLRDDPQIQTDGPGRWYSVTGGDQVQAALAASSSPGSPACRA